MKYALVLEKDTARCNKTSNVLSSMGYLITPVFNPKKALHAVHMIQFDLIVTCTAVNPGDRRSLTGELKRCSPDSILILLADPQTGPHFNSNHDGTDAILERPLTVPSLNNVLDFNLHDGFSVSAFARRFERRSRAID
jgi:DNA-binding response OmpR family regulator